MLTYRAPAPHGTGLDHSPPSMISPNHGAARHRPAAGSRTGGNQPGQANHRRRRDDSQLAANVCTDGVEPSRAAAASTSPMTGASLKRFSP